MAGWFDSFNPLKAQYEANSSQWDTNLNNLLNKQGSLTSNPGGWWEYDQTRDGNQQGYRQRLGQTLADSLAKQGYYTSQRDYENLGSNIANLVQLSRLKALSSPTGVGATNDTVAGYLRDHIKDYLLGGNMTAAAGLGGTDYRNTYNQIAANAEAARQNDPTGNTYGTYQKNAGNILNGLGTLADLQTGGGLRSSVGETLNNLSTRARDNGVFWQDANGQNLQPWGAWGASNLQFAPPAAPTPTPDPSQSPGNPANPTPPAATPPPYGGATPQGPGAPPTVPAGTDPNASKLAVPAAATNPTGWTIAPAMNPGADVSFDRQLGTLWTNLFGRAPTPQERQQWMSRLYDRYGGDASAVIRDLENSAPAQRYKQTGVAAPVVQNAQDQAGASAYYDWLQPGQTPEDWIRGYLQQIGGA